MQIAHGMPMELSSGLPEVYPAHLPIYSIFFSPLARIFVVHYAAFLFFLCEFSRENAENGKKIWQR